VLFIFSHVLHEFFFIEFFFCFVSLVIVNNFFKHILLLLQNEN